VNAHALIDRMERFPAVLRALTDGLTPEQARRRPPSGAWSIVEIVCHLVDEEAEDFRARARLTLEDPAAPWPGIDPEGAARTRGYIDRELAQMVQRFENERRESVAWLRSLRAPNWENAYQHPRLGPIRAGDLLTAWAAHDTLHLRQIAKRLHELAAADGEPFSASYAGQWGP
jgi:hypothetical protein